MFSGIGGFEHGLQNSKYDFECVSFSEVDKYATSIYLRHFPTHRNLGDATRLDTKGIEDFTLLIGGFPCQAFSLAGKRKGFEDTRGTLFFEIARVLRDKKPSYFLLENVKGLLSQEEGRTLKTSLGVLSDLGYIVQWGLYNSKDYGVPQNRERVFFKGYLRAECGAEVLSEPRSSKETTSRITQPLNDKSQSQTVYNPNGLAKTITGCGGGQGAKTGLYKIQKIGSVNGHQSGDVYNPNGVSRTLCSTDWKAPLKIVTNTKKGYDEAYPCDGVRLDHPEGTTGRGRVQQGSIGTLSCQCEWGTVCKPVLTPERENKRQNGRRMKEDGEPAFTLTAQDQHGVTDGYRIRRLTPVECERLQGFPDDWTLYGVDGELISDTQRYKCIGNAVTTNVITAIVDEMFDKIKENQK